MKRFPHLYKKSHMAKRFQKLIESEQEDDILKYTKDSSYYVNFIIFILFILLCIYLVIRLITSFFT